ncbi:MAG: hypothetical protein ABT940_12735 [Alphaproteobacteria bacterium]
MIGGALVDLVTGDGAEAGADGNDGPGGPSEDGVDGAALGQAPAGVHGADGGGADSIAFQQAEGAVGQGLAAPVDGGQQQEGDEAGEKVRELAELRRDRDLAAAKKSEASAAIEASKEYEAYTLAKFWVEELDAQIENREHWLRGEALLMFEASGTKQPHPAVTVKLFDVLSYENGRALAYCINHLPTALKLDKAAFERAAKAIPMGFVTVTKEPRAQIAGDLSAYLERGENR